MTTIILDGICVVLIGVSAIAAYFKGFVQTVLGLVSVLASCALAAFATGHFTPVVSEQVVAPMVSAAIGQYLPEAVEKQAAAAVTAAAGDFGGKILESVGGTIGQMAIGIAEAAGRQVSLPLAESLTRVVLFILFFIAFSLLFKVVIFMVDAVFHLPVLNSLNRLAGFSVGLVRGAVLAGLFCVVLSFVIMTFGDLSEPPVGYSDIESTMVMRYIYDSSLVKPFLFD